MLKVQLKERNLQYREKLLLEARRRYMDLPRHFCIFSLWCERLYCTESQFHNFESLESHVQFTNDWVCDSEACKPMGSENTVVWTKVCIILCIYLIN